MKSATTESEGSGTLKSSKLEQYFYKFPYEFTSQLGTSVTTGASVLFVQCRCAPTETQHTDRKGPPKSARFTLFLKPTI